MNTAITALDKIYSEILVPDEYSQDVLNGFKETLNRIKAEWTRRSRIQAIADSITTDGFEAFAKKLHALSATINVQYANGNVNCLERAEFQMMCEAEDLWNKTNAKKAAKEAEEARLREEPLRLQKLREEELLAEARRRLAEERREQAIRALMDSLRDERA
jgi:hypothetical protein